MQENKKYEAPLLDFVSLDPIDTILTSSVSGDDFSSEKTYDEWY